MIFGLATGGILKKANAYDPILIFQRKTKTSGSSNLLKEPMRLSSDKSKPIFLRTRCNNNSEIDINSIKT
jgi:hypothetical protein